MRGDGSVSVRGFRIPAPRREEPTLAVPVVNDSYTCLCGGLGIFVNLMLNQGDLASIALYSPPVIISNAHERFDLE